MNPHIERKETIISAFIDDPAVRSVLSCFIKGLPSRLENLRNAVENSDWKSVQFVSHALCGTAANFGYPQIMSVCSSIENTAKLHSKISADDLAQLSQFIEQAILGYASFEESQSQH